MSERISDNIIIYTLLDCIHCDRMKANLDKLGYKYTIVSNIDTLNVKNIPIVPALEINGRLLQHHEALDWVEDRLGERMSPAEKPLLTKAFLRKYPDHPEHMLDIGAFTYYRTYSRYLHDEKRRETWKETVARAVEYSVGLDRAHRVKNRMPIPEKWLRKEAQDLFDAIFNLKMFISGRTLWVAGTEAARKFPMSNFNCSFTNVEEWSDLPEIFYLLMLGSGVGFKSTKEMAAKMPPIRINTNLIISPYKPVPVEERLENTSLRTLENGYAKIYVGDSKEGWRDALDAYLKILTEERYEFIHTVKVSFNSIRPRGDRLMTFGGTASGPEPLMEMFSGIDKVLKNQIDPYLDPIIPNEKGYGRVRPIHILDIENLIGNNVVSGGVRRCLPEGTLVHTSSGLVKIEDVKIGDKVVTSDGLHEVTDWVEQGVQEILEIRHQHGVFKCTPKHKMAVMTSPGKYEWKMAKDLTAEDMLVFVDNTIDNHPVPVPQNEVDDNGFVAKEMTTDYAWLIGYIQGNGYVNIDGGQLSISIPTKNNKWMIDKAKRILDSYTERESRYKAVHKGYVVLESGNAPLVRWLYRHVKQANVSMNVPTFILQGSKEIRGAYLSGLYDADGSTSDRPLILLTSIYPDFLRQVQATWASIGIPVRLRLRRKCINSWKELYQLTVVGEKARGRAIEVLGGNQSKLDVSTWSTRESKNGFGYPSKWFKEGVSFHKNMWSQSNKQMAVETYERITGEKQHLYPVKIHDVIYTKEKVQTYDISVDSVHEFVAESGILTHNTASIFLFDADDYESLFAKYAMYGLEGDWQFDHHAKVVKELKRLGIPIPGRFKDIETVRYKKDDNGEFVMDSDGNKIRIYPKQDSISHRRMSNNSIAFTSKPSDDFLKFVFSMMRNEGEPGFINIEAGQKRRPNMHGINPCAEILLDSKQQCNLTTINLAGHIAEDGSFDEASEKSAMHVQALSVRAGIRMTLVDLELPKWDANNKRDRLTGCSMTGIQDAFAKVDVESQKAILSTLRKVAHDEAMRYSSELRIVTPLLTTAIKPEGSQSIVAGGVSPGVHDSHSPYHIRRIRIANNDTLGQVARDLGWHVEQDMTTPGNLVVDFPIKSNAVRTKDDVSAAEQFNRYLMFQEHYTDHNTSNTINVKDDEWESIEKAVSDNWDDFVGVSFLSHFGGNYPQAPYEAITKERYEELAKNMKPFDVSVLAKYDRGDDHTLEDNDPTCATGSCPVR